MRPHIEEAWRALRAVLFTRQIEFRRTHNLVDLVSLLHQNGVETPLTDDQLLRLNPFAVTFRYDDYGRSVAYAG